jgi:hypothetical protein
MAQAKVVSKISNFYSIIYYNSEIWHLPKLNPLLKIHLLTASATALKLCTPNYDQTISYKLLHEINSRAKLPHRYSIISTLCCFAKILMTKKPPLIGISKVVKPVPGWVEVKGILRIAFGNQKSFKSFKVICHITFCLN